MGNTAKVNITLPAEDLSRLDTFAQKEHLTRSGLIREAVRSFMRQREEEEKRRKERMQEAALDIRKLREKADSWDGISEIRRWREAR